MRRIGVYCGSLALLFACSGDASRTGASKERVVEGGGYVLPVPAGYEIARAEELKPIFAAGGAVLARSAGDPAKFRGSIVVAPVEGALELDPTDEASCKAFAEAGARSLSTELLAAGLIETSWGKTCQWQVRADEGGKIHQATGTVMKAGERTYVMTCNYDPDDRRAQGGCEQAITGWQVAKP